MDIGPSPPLDPFNLQESRRERALRRTGVRRRWAIGILVSAVVLAGVGYGTYLLVTGGSADTAQSTSTSSGSSTSTSGLTSSTTSSSSTTLANLTPQKLDITASPEFVNLTVTLQDGTTLTGKTPFSQEVPGGAIQIEFTKTGYNNAERKLTLDQATTMKVWLDPAGQLYASLVRFNCGPKPEQVAFSPDGKELWVSALGGDGLEVYDPATGVKTGTVKLGKGGAAELIFTAGGNTVYASQPGTALVYEVDRATRTVKRQFATQGTSTEALLLSPDEKTLWASNPGSDDVSQIDLGTGKTVKRIATVGGPRGLYETSDGARLYVAGSEKGEIQRIDLATGTGTVLKKTGGSMWDMVADKDAGLLYVDDASTNEVYVVALATEQVVKLADTDRRPAAMDLSPDGKVLYVCNRGRENPQDSAAAGPEWGTVLAIDAASGELLDAIVGGNQCTGLDVSSDGSLLAFSDFLDGHARVYAIPGYETLAAGGGGRADDRFVDIIKD